MKYKKPIIAAVILVLVGGIAYVICAVRHLVNETVPNAYAQEWVGGIVVDYLRQNDDRWPRSWEDLRPVYEQHVEEVGRPWTFEELQSRVEVQWDVDVDRLRQAAPSGDGAPPFRVIRLRDGSRVHWAGHEANEMIRRYLTSPDRRRPPASREAVPR